MAAVIVNMSSSESSTIVLLAGYLEVTPKALFLDLGMCSMLNKYIRVLSFRLITLRFLMSSMFICPVMETRGLGSVP